jgi:maltose O-acetyltransferase
MYKLMRSLYTALHQRKIDSYLDGLKQQGLKIGESVNILEPFFIDPDHCFLISIGSNSTLAPNVRLIAHDASTKRHLDFTRIGKIVIGDNCFIGDSVIVLPGVTIGSNTIIGAGAVVNRDLPENVVAAGNPARIICTLDDYLERNREIAMEKGVYGDDYRIDNITPKKMAEMLAALEKQVGYIV